MKALTSRQKEKLTLQLKKTRDVSERNRLCVILGYDEGFSAEVLSKTLKIGLSTVFCYLKEYSEQGKTENNEKGGSEGKLSKEEEASLEQHLEEITYLKLKDICAYVERVYKVKYSWSGMAKWLKTRGFVSKKPKKVPGNASPEQQEEFIKEYQKLKESLGPNEEIHFVDAVHPDYQSQAVCGWIKKGEEKTLKTTAKQPRLHLVGGICLKTQQVFTQEYKHVDTDAMIDFFKKLEASTDASRINVMLDNARAQKNKRIAEFFKTVESKIKLHYLPPYSPNLNAIERLWKVLRERKMYNKWYNSAANLFQEIRGFFKNDLSQLTHIWGKRLNDKFQKIKLNPIKLSL